MSPECSSRSFVLSELRSLRNSILFSRAKFRPSRTLTNFKARNLPRGEIRRSCGEIRRERRCLKSPYIISPKSQPFLAPSPPLSSPYQPQSSYSPHQLLVQLSIMSSTSLPKSMRALKTQPNKQIGVVEAPLPADAQSLGEDYVLVSSQFVTNHSLR